MSGREFGGGMLLPCASRRTRNYYVWIVVSVLAIASGWSYEEPVHSQITRSAVFSSDGLRVFMSDCFGSTSLPFALSPTLATQDPVSLGIVRKPLRSTQEAVWTAMKQRLVAGDISGTISYFSASTADRYRRAFQSIAQTELSGVTSEIPAISPVLIESESAQYRFDQMIQGILITFPIDFSKENGLWKINGILGASRNGK